MLAQAGCFIVRRIRLPLRATGRSLSGSGWPERRGSLWTHGGASAGLLLAVWHGPHVRDCGLCFGFLRPGGLGPHIQRGWAC